MEAEMLGKLIDQVSGAIRDNADDLTKLDQAIGDGDHGLNMKRGFDAVTEAREEIIGLAPAAALQKIGMTLVMKVGGASGPLYGSLFLGMSKVMTEPPRTAGAAADLLGAGIDAVMSRGKSTTGEKTMLDVLVPVRQALAEASGLETKDALEKLRAVARDSAEATIPMQATKGRASFLGERSIGHMDPGARSSALMVTAVCDALEGEGAR